MMLPVTKEGSQHPEIGSNPRATLEIPFVRFFLVNSGVKCPAFPARMTRSQSRRASESSAVIL